MKVCVLAGLTYQTVDEYRKNPKLSDTEKKFKVATRVRIGSRL